VGQLYDVRRDSPTMSAMGQYLPKSDVCVTSGQRSFEKRSSEPAASFRYRVITNGRTRPAASSPGISRPATARRP